MQCTFTKFCFIDSVAIAYISVFYLFDGDFALLFLHY